MDLIEKFLDFVKTDAILLFLFFVVYALGSFGSYKKNANQQQCQSYNLFLGNFVICIWGWGAYLLKSSMPLSITIIGTISIINLFGFLSLSFANIHKRTQLKNLFIDSSIILTLSCLIFQGITQASPHSVVTAKGNIDLFNWSLVADYIKSGHGFLSVVPNGVNFIHDNIENGFGTYYLLAFFAKFLDGSTLEATTY